MKMSEIKEKLKSGEHVLGTMITVFSSPNIIRILQQCGYDFVIIDCEHGGFDYSEAAGMLGMARAAGLPAMVRIPEIRREPVLKYMEMGADGLLLPSTETKEQAELLVRYAKYAPMGDRGISFSRPHTGFTKVKGPDYMSETNRDTMLMCQIETRQGVEHIDDIIGTEGIDVAFVGPNDLSNSYGVLGDYYNPVMQEAYEKILQAARKAGKAAGAHFGSRAGLLPLARKGYTMNMCGADVSLMMIGARTDIEAIRNELDRE